jgi:hypothetical protein
MSTILLKTTNPRPLTGGLVLSRAGVRNRSEAEPEGMEKAPKKEIMQFTWILSNSRACHERICLMPTIISWTAVSSSSI